jgi:proliferating cell nuclear antigen
MNEANNVLTIKTVQIQPMRNMTAAIKDILTDATITFTKNGMKIVNFDKTHTILVKVVLLNSRFEYYKCEPKQIIICANTLHLSKVISTVSNNDTLSMYIEKEDYNDGIVSHLGLQYDNSQVKQCQIQKLRLIEPDQENLDIPDVEFSTIISLSTADFQKIIRDMSGLSDRVEITSVGSELTFSCEGSFAKSKIIRSESDGSLDFKKKPDAAEIFQGEFSLKSLTHFTKCTPLCSHLEMCMKNNLPLVVKYDVASLGEIKLCLAPLPPA